MRKEKVGDVYKIEFARDKFVFAQVVHKGLIKFFIQFFNTPVLFENVKSILSSERSFSVYVHKDYLRSENWVFEGNYELLDKTLPVFFRQDLLNPQDCVIVDVFGNKKNVKPIECLGLERSAVWDTNHVEDRLRNIVLHRDDDNVKMMAVKLS